MKIVGADEAQKAVEAHTTPRAQGLDLLERYVDGTQYAGRASFYDETRPLQERAPCVVYKLVASAISSNVDLVLGEGRFPQLTTNPGEDDQAWGDTGLSKEASKTLDRGISEVLRQTRLKAVAREALGEAQGCGTAVSLIGVRAGKLFVDSVKAKWCEAEHDNDGRVTKLTIQYPYTETVRQPDATYRVVAKVYRRVIDAQRDVTMIPVEARGDRAIVEADWKADPAQTFEHGFGFCPVVWYAHMRGCTMSGERDGRAIHARALPEIEAHDFSLSMRHRAAIYAGDPTLCEYGVEPGSNPGQAGRTAAAPATQHGGKPSTANPVVANYVVPTQPARKKGVTQLWQYESDKARAEYLTLPPDAVKALDDDAHDLRQKIAESLCVVFMDPENVKFAATVSGKALETLRERQLNRCDQIRDDFGDGFLLPLVSLLLRVVRVSVRMGTVLRLPGAAKISEVLQRFEETPANENGDGAAPSQTASSLTWVDPLILLRWGGYFKPDADAEQKLVTTVVAARTARVITARMALEKVAGVFGIENIDQAEKALADELDEHASAEAAAKASAGADDGEDESATDDQGDKAA